MNQIVIAQIIGFIALVENFFIYLSNRRERILKLKLLSDGLWMVNYILMGGLSGALLNGIAIFREYVFLKRDTQKWAGLPWWPFVFVGLTWLSPAMDWIQLGRITLLPVLPTLGSMSLVIGLAQKKTAVTKLCSMVDGILWLTYAASIGNITAIISSAIGITSSLIGLVRERIGKSS